MKYIAIELEEKPYTNRIFDRYFKDRRIGVLDIETTGLDRKRCAFILGGLLDVKSGMFHQVFAQNTGEEAEALRAFARIVEPLEVVITYNGRQFDMPFLAQRCQRHGVDMGAPYDLDLYHMVRWNSPLKRLLPNLKQVSVENYLGLWMDRTDEISGAESVDLYLDYARTGDPEKERKILLHNSDDVCQLTKLTRVMEKCDFHRAMNTMGFPAGPPGSGLVVSRIGFDRGALVISGDQRKNRSQFRCYELEGYPAEASFEREKGTFEIRIPLVCSEGIDAVDLRAAGLDEEEFAAYPGSGSGFLAVRQNGEIMNRECNHLTDTFIKKLADLLQ